MTAPDFDRQKALTQHLDALLQRREQLDKLIDNVTQTMGAMKGEITMTDKQKFEGFKRELIDENEKKYGKEVRARLGDDVIDAANAKLERNTKVDYESIEALTEAVQEAI